MQLQTLLSTTALLILSTSASTLTPRQESTDRCQAIYQQCLAMGKLDDACRCDLTACVGEDAARIREWCASRTASGQYPPSATATGTATAPSGASNIITGTAGSQPSGQAPITAPAGSLALGATCSDDRQCAGGAQCWASTAWLIRSCGNFNAACAADSQCAFNTCNRGLCNGFKASSSVVSSAATGSSSRGVSSATASASRSGSGSTTVYNATNPIGSTTFSTWTGLASRSSSATTTAPAQFTGAASRKGVEAVLALAVGVLPFALRASNVVM